MRERTLTINMGAKKNLVQATVNRMAYYHRIKVIEAITSDQECFYLIFYKDQFITGMATKLKKTSQLNKLLKKGITFTSPHPLIDSFLNYNQTYTLKPIEQLLTALQKKYTLQEVSLILTFFDSILPKEKIENAIKEFFYIYRRNGQLGLAFQLLVILLTFDTKNKWALDISNQMDYEKYKNIYEGNESHLPETDPLYSEIHYFNHKNKRANFDSLQAMLARESNWRDRLALYIDRLSSPKTFSKQDYKSFITILFEHLSSHEGTIMVWMYYNQMSLDDEAIQHLVERLLNHEMHEELINVITDHPRFKEYQGHIPTIFQQKTLQINKINLEPLRSYLINEPSPQNVEVVLCSVIPRLFDVYELDGVYNWLEPLLQSELQLPILKDIQSMILFQDDPDEQFSLGKLYYKLKQKQKAIECFKWVMELNPSDPTPVQWVSKLYHEVGMVEESNNYKYIYTNLQKLSS